jgi:hypothetical protein
VLAPLALALALRGEARWPLSRSRLPCSSSPSCSSRGATLGATDAFYIGALGSRRNQERRRERLLREGLDEAALDRISGPSGLEVSASTPVETAVRSSRRSLRRARDAKAAGEDGGRTNARGGLEA